MKTYLASFLISATATWLMTPLVRRFAPKLGAVDVPSRRRVNKWVVPRLGGLAVCIGFFTPLIALLFYNSSISSTFWTDSSRVIALLLGALIMIALGIIDDMKSIGVTVKLSVQFFVAILAYFLGFSIESIHVPFVGQVPMGAFALPLTTLWIVGIINAVNLIDGLDGLAAGVAFLVCIVNLIIAIVNGTQLVALLSAALGGALVGFLIFNFNPATIFLGDSGSLFIGFVLATTSIHGAKGSTAVALLVPILAMGLPIFDTLFAICRRLIEKRSIFASDNSHIHHLLIEMGLTHKRAVILLYAITGLFAATAIVVHFGRDWQVGAALVVASIVIIGMIRAFGTFHLRSMRRKQLESTQSPVFQGIRKALPLLLQQMRQAKSFSQLTPAMERFASKAGLSLVALRDENHDHQWLWKHGPINDKNLNHIAKYVSTTFPIHLNHNQAGEIEFGWHDDAGEVSTNVDTLLYIVADETEGFLLSHSRDPSYDSKIAL